MNFDFDMAWEGLKSFLKTRRLRVIMNFDFDMAWEAAKMIFEGIMMIIEGSLKLKMACGF